MITNLLSIGITSPQLSHTLPLTDKPTKEYITEHKLEGSWFISEKFDGIRAIWTGGELITRSWRTFNYVPEWFIKQLPIGIPLDGELYIPDVDFSYFSSLSVTKKCERVDEKWKKIIYLIFDAPMKNIQFQDRLSYLRKLKFKGNFIKLINFEKLNNIDREFQKINEKFKEVAAPGWVKEKAVLLYEIKLQAKQISLNIVVGPTVDDSRNKIVDHYKQMTNILIKDSSPLKYLTRRSSTSNDTGSEALVFH
jgi:hypothetical protein